MSSTRRAGTTILTALAALTAGCPPQPSAPPSTTDPRSAPFLDVDGNFSFAAATAIALENDQRLFSGEVSAEGDVDLYRIASPINPGDAITIEIDRSTGNLDPIAALFDAQERLVAYNDDRAAGDLSGNGGNLNPRIEIVLPGDEVKELVIGVAQFPGSGSSGEYVVSVNVQRGVGVPVPRGQIVYLDYRGGNSVSVPNVGRFDLPPFDAAQLGPSFDGQTTTIKNQIESVVRERYSPYNLLVLNSDEATEPAAPHSTVYFGGFNERAFAIAEDIDTFNENLTDKAIIFTRSFDDAFSTPPSTEQMATAIGNTVAHEIGHLLGLVHTADCDDLMDATCGNNRILTKQIFRAAGLDPFVFPVGTQDAALLLEWALGLVGL